MSATTAAPGLGADGIVITPMRRRHLRGVVRIERATSHRPWSTNLFQGELHLGDERYYVVALEGATVVGYGGLMFTGFEAHLTILATDPQRRRAQVATRILLVLFGECRRRGVEEMTLEVRATNHGAQALYHRFGFVPAGIRPGYYAEVGEDALIMWSHDLCTDAMATRLEGLAAELRAPLRTEGIGP